MAEIKEASALAKQLAGYSGTTLSPDNPYNDALNTFANNGIPDATNRQWVDAAVKWEQDQKNAKNDAQTKAELAPPEQDPRYQQLLEQQQTLAKDFRNNIPQLADTFMGQVAEVAKKQLATSMENTRQNYNSRGLLYSTARLGAEASNREAEAGDLATKRASINSNLNDEADTLDKQALDTGFNIATMGQTAASQNTTQQSAYLDQALKNQQQQAASVAGLAKGLGGAAGTAAGLLGKTATTGNGFATTNPTTNGANTDNSYGSIA